MEPGYLNPGCHNQAGANEKGASNRSFFFVYSLVILKSLFIGSNAMRVILLFSLSFCAFAVADEFQSCSEIKSALERLDCYDRLARESYPGPEPLVESAPMTPTTLRPESAQTGSLEPEQEQVPELVKSQPDATSKAEPGEDSSRWNLFGLKPKIDKSTEITRISATLEKVDYMSNGKKVFTLSNGQHWIEREPGARKVAAGQQVTIIKKRWHFELDPERGPKVTVERLDPDKYIVRTDSRREI
jgi:hypothetical protein